jgi:hypothetical protein
MMPTLRVAVSGLPDDECSGAAVNVHYAQFADQ